MRPSKEKMHANTSIFDPSFVYRQDGYELSYKIAVVFYYKKRILSRKKEAAYAASKKTFTPGK